MKRGTPLKRTGFARKESAERALIVHKPLTRAPNYAVCTVALPLPKEMPVRSEAYRRLVAARPCILCEMEGYSQHAHGNTGKGMGIKTDDRFAFPLCAPRPGDMGCHARLDQSGIYTKDMRRQLEKLWARLTVKAILDGGLWPAGLPIPEWAE